MTGQPLDIKIESRNVGMTPRWKTEIERRVHALESGIIRPTHARVTLTKNAHHKKGDDNAEALVVVTLPPKRTVTARKESKTFEEAIRAAFHAVEHELEKIEEKRVARAAKAAGKKALKIEALSVA
ncbi:MAG: HPF/RaiA family ribosome-associated protein [Nitrospirota bacterium]|nr:HPF/RaiA family ribosome-associated protein [Nitrospirota bacterium]MDH5587509.1 HPF/RaiA family ribosome-associated protein [Nitrospirota bacterium]MDH5774760.1 HPF/RaiA family ribosome-associated protein [Nitrospirota bacterium]